MTYSILPNLVQPYLPTALALSRDTKSQRPLLTIQSNIGGTIGGHLGSFQDECRFILNHSNSPGTRTEALLGGFFNSVLKMVPQ